MKTLIAFFRKKIVLYPLIGLVIFIALIAFLVHRHNEKSYTYVPVTMGPITETVSVTGNTTPTASVSLGFGNSGTVSQIFSAIGQNVSVGAVLATLDTSDLLAQEKQAQANVDTQNAKLQGLEVGATPQSIAVSQTQLAEAQQSLTNMYANIGTTLTSAYTSSIDAIYNQLSAFFSNGDTNPQLDFSSSDSQGVINATSERLKVATELTTWHTELNGITASSTTADLNTALQNASAHLVVIQNFLNDVANVTNAALTTPPGVSSLAALKSSVASAVTEINTATTGINTTTQNISSQELTVAQLEAELNLTEAGSTSQDIAAQQAQVEEAQASVASVQAQLADSEIIAPQNGVITQFDAKVGQIATPGTPLISIISGNSFEIDALVSEVDIGKVAVGDKVSMTLDAFPGETFTGSVFYIDPAQTDNAGVVGYLVKVAFDTPDPRIKSGLTVNLDITTDHADNVLILPQYAILQNDAGAFVEVLQNNKVVQVPVTLGIADENGNVEITSGVTDGEQVLNIGLK